MSTAQSSPRPIVFGLWIALLTLLLTSSAFAQNCTPTLRDACDDRNVCTIDTCECPNGLPPCFCEYEPFICVDAFAPCNNVWCVPGEGEGAGCHAEAIVCDDGEWCTDPDICIPGTGCYFLDRDCRDGNACTTGYCDQLNQVCRNDTIPCDDNNVCNGMETCDQFDGCQPGQPLDCDDGDFCTDDSCTPETGCEHLDVSDMCLDANSCTIDSCDPTTGCVFDEIVCDDLDECTKDLDCDPGTGLCPTDCYDIGNDPPTYGIPRADDRTFVATAATVGPLSILAEVLTTRYAGKTVAGTGRLDNAAALIAAGVLGSHAELTIEAYHVRCASVGACAIANTVFFNGVPVDELDPSANPFPALSGPCGDSQPNVFLIPIDQVNFPDAVGIGGAPAAASNIVEIRFAEPDDCRSLAYASLKIRIMSPVILVHGTGSGSDFFDRQGLTDAWEVFDEGAVPLVWNNQPHQRIDLPPGTRAQHAAWLADDVDDPAPAVANLKDIANEFGVDSVHIVAHGTGGLDVREYLQDRYRSQRTGPGGPFEVLSLTTLGTPHNGSPAADQLVNVALVVRGDLDLLYVGFPSFAVVVGDLMGSAAATPDQTTPSGLTFNTKNLALLPSGIVYNTLGGEADGNGNGHLDSDPDEWGTLAMEEASLVHSAANMAYRVLRATPTMTVGLDVVPGTSNVFQAYLVYPPAGTGSPNDAVVTESSASGAGGMAGVVAGSAGWRRTMSGANHVSLARPPSARQVALWLRNVERIKGDLR